jgi:hypothetical protein
VQSIAVIESRGRASVDEMHTFRQTFFTEVLAGR